MREPTIYIHGYLGTTYPCTPVAVISTSPTSMLNCYIPFNKDSKKNLVATWTRTLRCLRLLTLQLNKRKISVAALLRSAYILQEITGNANIEICLGGMTHALSKGKFTRNPRSRCDGESQPPPSPSSAGRSER